ncbi:sugar transporter [Viridothelium virens]|uniref:Sugar transporter n=1 Tax=Viridothelium virens TaxID=1048519 RepID=A0A6A6HAL9_VIRVR|nr:sugar transporter [Viridothelium virens]
MAAGWFYSPKQIVRYFLTRPTSLKPPRSRLRNPISVLSELDRHQWLMFSVGFCAWMWDAFDFFTVSLTVTEIAADFGESNSDVSWGITVTLMLRSVGALIFGSLADRYGRKWPVIFNLTAFIILELASGFTNSLTQFLAVRSLYGIAMGGLLGPAAATALEDIPYEARGILSGLFQEAYAVGYLMAALFYRALVPTTSHGWRSLFWFGAGPPVLIIIFRLCLPETNAFQVMKAEREAKLAAEKAGTRVVGDGIQEESMAGVQTAGDVERKGIKAFLSEAGRAFRANWFLIIYMIVLMSGYNACSHGSQDFYPTFLKDQAGFGATDVTVITVVGQIGCTIGACVFGYLSTFVGRRLIMMTACVFGGALIPAYILPRNMSLVASSFFQQFFVGAVWGPIPIHLIELSPPAMRSLVVGLTYQLGNLASSASATIQGKIGEKHPLPPLATGVKRYDYGIVIAEFMGGVFAYQFFFLFLGPEMSEDEKEEMAQEAKEFERLRAEGRSLAEIGASRVNTKDSDSDEKAAGEVEHVEHPVETV